MRLTANYELEFIGFYFGNVPVVFFKNNQHTSNDKQRVSILQYFASREQVNATDLECVVLWHRKAVDLPCKSRSTA